MKLTTRWTTKKFETYKYLMVGWKRHTPIYDVDKTWCLKIGSKIHYLCRSPVRPQRLIDFMYLVPDFYIFKFWNYFCYWSSEPSKVYSYVAETPPTLAAECAARKEELYKTIFKP